MNRLEAVRHELLALHRALLHAQRSAHERAHGPLSASAFLELVIGAPAFAWLRPMTALIVAIDEAIDEANPSSARARRLALIAAKKAASDAPDGSEAATAASDGESADSDTAAAAETLLLTDTRKLLLPDPEDSEFQLRFAIALQHSPELALAHAAVLRALAQADRSAPESLD